MSSNKQKYAHPEYLIETENLALQLDDEDLRIYDCGVKVMPNPDDAQKINIPFVFQSGKETYQQAHIPGAAHIDIVTELSDHSSILPLMLPPIEQFTKVMSQYGISSKSRVVLYSTAEPNWAARVWWMLRAFGFKQAVILNGGWQKWTAEGRAVSINDCNYAPAQFTAKRQSNLFVNKAEVLAGVEDDEVCIVSALPPGMYTGESDMVFGRKGHISGSVNVPFSSLHNPMNQTYLTAEDLQKNFDSVNVGKSNKVITYCGAGIAAANNAFALKLLGYENIAVYDGSMFEWGNDSFLPMES